MLTFHSEINFAQIALQTYIMKNIYLSLFLLVFCFYSSIGQKTTQSSNLSNKIYISIKKGASQSAFKEAAKPPYLEISNAVFSDGQEGNRKIDAEETTEIRFELKNSGLGNGKNLILSTKESNGLIGLAYESSKKIIDLAPGQSNQIVLPIKGLKNLEEGTASFEIKVIEPNGFGTDPIHIQVGTQSFRTPNLKVADYQVSSVNLMY